MRISSNLKAWWRQRAIFIFSLNIVKEAPWNNYYKREENCPKMKHCNISNN